MTNTVKFNDQNTVLSSKGRASFDRTHRMIANFDYQLPGLTGAGLKAKLLSGWSLAGIVIVQSGLPMTLTDPNGGAVYGRAGTSTVDHVPWRDLRRSRHPGQRFRTAWQLDQHGCDLPAPAVGSDGSTGYGNAGQSIMNGPGQVNTDFSLGKRTRVGRPARGRRTGLPRGVLQCAEPCAVRQSGHDARDGELRRDHADLGGAAADSVRTEVPVLEATAIIEEGAASAARARIASSKRVGESRRRAEDARVGDDTAETLQPPVGEQHGHRQRLVADQDADVGSSTEER